MHGRTEGSAQSQRKHIEGDGRQGYVSKHDKQLLYRLNQGLLVAFSGGRGQQQKRRSRRTLQRTVGNFQEMLFVSWRLQVMRHAELDRASKKWEPKLIDKSRNQSF